MNVMMSAPLQGANTIAYDERRFRGSPTLTIVVITALAIPLVVGFLFIEFTRYYFAGDTMVGAIAEVVWAPIQRIQYGWSTLGYGGYSELVRSPVEAIVLPVLSGLTLSAGVGAIWCAIQRRQFEAGVCLLAVTGISLAAVAAEASSQRGFSIAGVALLVHAGYLMALGAIGVGAIIAAQRVQSEFGALPPESARAVWRSERRAAQLAVVAPMQVGGSSDLSGPTDPSVPFTPTNAPLGEYATFGTRLGARLLDVLTLLLIWPLELGAAALVATSLGVDDAGPTVILAALVGSPLAVTAYYLVGASHGQTLGKQNRGIRVCREDGRRLGFWLAVGRELASFVSSLPFMIGWLAPLWTPKRQTWHDTMTSTIVVRDPASRLAKRAVVWAVVWSLVTGAGFGVLGATVFDDFDSGGSFGTTSYYDEGNYYDDGSDGFCDTLEYYDPDC